MLEAFRVLEEEKHINKEDIIDAVVESLKSAYKRRYGQSESAVVEFNEKTGDFQVYTVREVVDEVFDSRLEISLKDALAISSAYELGDKIRFEESVDEFGRVAAQSAKQNMKVKSCKEQLNASTNVSFMSILERSKLNCHAKIKFLVKALSHMMSLMFMFIKLKTTLKVLTSLSAVAIQNSSNVSWNKKFQKYLMEL